MAGAIPARGRCGRLLARAVASVIAVAGVAVYAALASSVRGGPQA
ncbi:MAG: hypothetical protein ACLUE1_05575 [Adlercreutzia equolifaciens]